MSYSAPPLTFRFLTLLLAVVGFSAAAPAPVATAESQLEPATQSAIFLMQRSVQVRRDGTHNQLLRSLRHLQDPLLEPMFAALADASHPALRIHGLLGLAELSDDGRLDLHRLIEIDDSALQAELISAAMDHDQLSTRDVQRLLEWSGLDLGVRLMAAAWLLEADQLTDKAVLHEGLEASRLARRGLAALMLHQMGDDAGTQALQELDRRQGGQRDAVRAMLLNTALQHRFHRSGGWAFAIATEPGVDSRLGLLALQTALRFGDPRAADHWRQQFASTSDLARQTRLALIALQMSPWLEGEVFAVLREADDALLAQVGRAGMAVASGDDIAEQARRLIDLQHGIATGWALRYARTEASPADAKQILMGVIEAYGDAPDAQRVRRLDEAVQATQALYELNPVEAEQLLRPRLTDRQTDPLLVRAILLGLVRTQHGEPHRLIADIDTWPDSDASRLALLLLARQGQAMTDRQLRDLGIIVQGGGGMQDSLRIQAAWSWLKRHGQTEQAVTHVIGGI